MAYLKSQIYSPSVAATVALHAAFGLALLQADGARSSTTVAVPVMVSLIESAGQERVTAPPKPLAEPRPAPKSPRPVPVTKAPEPAPAEATPANAAPEPMIALPSASTAKASEQASAETRPVDDALAPESSITLPRFNADYLNNPPPVYPTLSRRLGEQGRVMLRALVRADGQPAEIRINRSSGFSRLDRAALEAVRQWRFIPAQQGNTPVPAWVLVPVSFTLEG
ncbi:MAG: energy transducer TonB [Sulfuricaulis sp.]|uniref:TonB family protein n=1 Tax=Sulfuricaulis sp. TaxID=2003553 RepID=UPI0034A13BBB